MAVSRWLLCLGCVVCVCSRRLGEKGYKNKNVLQGKARGMGVRGEEVSGGHGISVADGENLWGRYKDQILVRESSISTQH